MSKFNTTGTKPQAISPVTTEKTPTLTTFEGGAGYRRDVKSDLFLLAVSNMVGEKTFYESAEDRDERYTQLVQLVAREDSQWMLRFLTWLRSEGNMRSASLVAAAEAVKARLCPGPPHSGHASSDWTCALEDGVKASGVTNRQLISAVLQRADEPGEMLAYWTAKHGRRIPKPVKRGIADAVLRLYNERSLLKYDTASKGYRFGDVLDLVHVGDKNAGGQHVPEWQAALFQHALNRRHNRDWSYDEVASVLPMVALNASLRDAAAEGRPFWNDPDPEQLKAAGFTWEDVLSLAGSKVDKAKLWEALIPSMGYMALLRNLRNFDEAGVSKQVAEQVAARLADPDQVAKSRQFPFRFLSAYEAAPSLRWGQALDEALQASLSNLPALKGRSLILIDTSASMTSTSYSAKSKVTPAKAAAVFGVALGARGENVDVVGFASGTFRHDIPKGASVIREVDRFLARIGEVGHGTDIVGSLRASYRGHDRVFIISDMQTIGGSYGGGVSEAVPANVPIYGFNLGGYESAAMATGSSNRHEFGGLTDATFRMVPLLEAGKNADWPF